MVQDFNWFDGVKVGHETRDPKRISAMKKNTVAQIRKITPKIQAKEIKLLIPANLEYKERDFSKKCKKIS
jgi:ribosomal protein S30